jgi:hypothetical protein
MVPIILLFINFIYRIINFSKIITIFPLDYSNDMTSYISFLHFLREYGLFNLVPNWYNGFILFETAAPGWALFTLPFYILSNNIMLSAFISTLTIYALGFIGVYMIGKHLKISVVKRTFFFLLVYANPMMIGGVLKQGRFPELLALTLLIYIFWICLYFKDNRINFKGFGLSFLIAALILTHQSETILSGVFLAGLLLVKKGKEKLHTIGYILLGIFLSSFWLIKFITSSLKLNMLDTKFGTWLLAFNSGFLLSNLILILLPLGIIVLFFYTHQQSQDKHKTFLFFIPTLLLAILVLFRIQAYIPILQQVYPDPFQNLFILVGGFFLVTINFRKLSINKHKILSILLILFAIGSVSYNFFYTPYISDHTSLDADLLSVFPSINNTYLIITSERLPNSYPNAYYSYGAIFYNKKTAAGWAEWLAPKVLIDDIGFTLENYRETHDCTTLRNNLEKIKVYNVVSTQDDCKYLSNVCSFTLLEKNGDACVVST